MIQSETSDGTGAEIAAGEDTARAVVPAGTGSPAQQPEPGSGERFRPDLEGLRGVAILLVLAFHAGLPGMGGGFVGVDVFFVLSGFLITGLLIREVEQHGRVDLRAFYARRARRILPAAAVVLVITLAASVILLAPLDLVRVAADGIASALSAGNIRFAAQEMDYFAPAGAPSPLLHYWSLGVEEQFYLVWPALLIVAVRFGRPRVGAGLALLAILAGSYAVALALTQTAPAWAFYSLPTRAWQLALGGLLAVTGLSGRFRAAILAPASWLGLGAILAAGVLVDPAKAYPGTAALLPSFGAAAVILGSAARLGAGLILGSPLLRFFGRISYSLYLVHWPILVLPAVGLAIGDELPPEIRAGLALASVAAGYASYRFIELPFHHGRRFAWPPNRTLALAGATIAVTVLAGGLVMANANRTLNAYASSPATDGGTAATTATAATATTPAPTGTQAPGPGSSPAPTGSSAAASSAASPAARSPGASGPTASPPSGSSAPARSPVPAGSSAPPASPAAPSPAATPAATPLPTIPPQPRGPQPLPPDVRPALAQARDDTELLVRNNCNLQPAQIRPLDCSFGDSASAITVALVGDSHTSQWFPAVEQIALERGWRLVTFTKYDCRFMDIQIYSAFLKREYTECPAWRELVIQRLQALRPQLVIVGVSRFPKVINAADDDPVRQGQALARVLAQVPGRIAILVDTPRFPFDVPGCISAHLADVRACEIPRAQAFLPRHRIVETTAATIVGATVVDLSSRICPWDSCPVVFDGMIIYRDNHHLTATFAASLAGPLAAALPDISGSAP